MSFLETARRYGQRTLQLWSGTPEEQAFIKAAEAKKAENTRGRLSHKDRRNIENASKARKAILTRRSFIVIAAGLTAGTAYSAVNYDFGDISKSDSERLEDAVKRIGINESEAERKLWDRAGFEALPRSVFERRLSPTEIQSYRGEAMTRMDRVLALMPESEDPQVRAAAAFIKNNNAGGMPTTLTIEVRDGSTAEPRYKYAMGVATRPLPDGRLDLVISPTMQGVLVVPPAELAYQLVHEAKHQERFKTIFSGMDASLPIQQRAILVEADRKATWNQKEAEAYGAQYIGLITHYGLTRRMIPGLRTALAMVEADMDPTSKKWQDYTTKYLVAR